MTDIRRIEMELNEGHRTFSAVRMRDLVAAVHEARAEAEGWRSIACALTGVAPEVYPLPWENPKPIAPVTQCVSCRKRTDDPHPQTDNRNLCGDCCDQHHCLICEQPKERTK